MQQVSSLFTEPGIEQIFWLSLWLQTAQKVSKTGRKHKDIKKQLSNKMQQLKKEKAASLTKEKKKLKDPDYLKAQTQPSPFS